MASISDDDLDEGTKPAPAKLPTKKPMFINRKKLPTKTSAKTVEETSKPDDGGVGFFSRSKNYASMAKLEAQKREEEKVKKQKARKVKEAEEQRIKEEKELKEKQKKEAREKAASTSPSKKRKSEDLGDDYTNAPSASSDDNQTAKSPKRTRSSLGSDDDCKIVSSSSIPKPSDDALEEVTVQIEKEKPVDLDPELAAEIRKRRAAKATTSSRTKSPTAASEPSPDDKVIEVLVVSTIPGSTPIAFKRKLGAKLGAVRAHYASRIGLSAQDTKRLILVWRGNLRVFDSSTCKGLKLKVNHSGSLYVDERGWAKRPSSESRKEGLEVELGVDGNDRAMFEAMFEEDYQRRKLEYEQDRLAGPDDAQLDMQHIDNGPDSAEDESEKITVKLRGKNFEQLDAQVDATAKVEELVSLLRSERDLKKESVTICFEGDDLDEGDVLQDIGIEDDEILDVRVK